jgi:hypothetical protein
MIDQKEPANLDETTPNPTEENGCRRIKKTMECG